MHETKAMLYLHALTGMHPGSGSALGTVDLPVQRERHNQWPTVPGSALKGVLRDAVRHEVNGGDLKEADKDADLVTAFGPPTDNAHDHSGAVSVSDARLLAFPVRSLKGVFAWVTCPTALQRYKRDLDLAGVATSWDVPEVKDSGDQQRCLTAGNAPLLVAGNHIILEEFEFQRTDSSEEIAAWIADHAVDDESTATRLRSHLVVISDDAFSHFARYATEVVARIGLDYERKTVREGALFYQEFLPAETLFYSLFFVSESRRKRNNDDDPDWKQATVNTAGEIFDFVKGKVPAILQVGGDETIGKGLCAVRMNRAEGGR